MAKIAETAKYKRMTIGKRLVLCVQRDLDRRGS